MNSFFRQIYLTIAQSPLGDADKLGIPKASADSNTIDTIISLILYIAGGLSVIFIIIGGIMYIFSAGNPDTAKRARTTLIYALVGLAVTVLAYAFVKFILDVVRGDAI